MQLFEMTWPQVGELSRHTPVVIPIAALEQHGPHLPVFTDSLLLGEIVRRAQERLRERVLFAPLMWLGNSEHHMDFAGTMSAAPRTYLNLLKEMVSNFLMHGFRSIVLLNGHGGNVVPSQQAMYELRQERREREDLRLLSATYWLAGEPPSDPSFSQPQVYHAGEWETSMMLHLHPQLVGEYRDLPPVPRMEPCAPAHSAWITKERSAPGYIGDPAAATAEKGARMLQHFAANVVTLLECVIDDARSVGGAPHM